MLRVILLKNMVEAGVADEDLTVQVSIRHWESAPMGIYLNTYGHLK